MKKRKLFLPLVALGVLFAFGLTACGGGGGGKEPEPVDPGDLPDITITAPGNKKEILVGETLQLSADVEGVTWTSRSPDVASVSATGLVEGLTVGSARIRAEKEGYDSAAITINVAKAPEREAKVKLPLEDAEHYSEDDFWGWDLTAYGMGIIGPGDSPVENNNGATEDGTSLGYLAQGDRETLTFTSNKAIQVELGVTMAYNAEMALDSVIEVKFNNKPISMAGRVCEGPEDGDTNNYYDFHTVSFGKVDLIDGNNVLVIEIIGQTAPNLDEVRLYTDEELVCATVPPAPKPSITVTPASVELLVGETQQLTSNVEGVAYASSAEGVATVSATGLITAVAQGNAEITVSKDGYKKATVAVKVSPVPVPGQVILEAEDAILPEGTAIQIENKSNASGGKSLGYFGAEQTFELKYTATEASAMKLSIVVSSAVLKSDYSGFDDMVLTDEVMTMKFNNAPVALGTSTIPGSQGWNNPVWKEIDLGEINLIAGENVFSFAAITQGPNIDCLKLTKPGVTITYTVSFDANGGTGEMADVPEVSGEYTLPANGFTAPEGQIFKGWLVGSETKQPGEKITVDANVTIKATWGLDIVKSEQVDLTNAFYAEAEKGQLAGGAQVESKGKAHDGKSVGYMAKDASITIKFDADKAGKAQLILLGGSANMNWSWSGVTYYDHALTGTTKITLNGAELSLAKKGFFASDADNMVQVDLGEVDILQGENVIVVTALAQAPNFDAFALLSETVNFIDNSPSHALTSAKVELREGVPYLVFTGTCKNATASMFGVTLQLNGQGAAAAQEVNATINDGAYEVAVDLSGVAEANYVVQLTLNGSTTPFSQMEQSTASTSSLNYTLSTMSYGQIYLILAIAAPQAE